MTDVLVDGESLTPEDVEAVARNDARVEIPEDARAAVRASRERVEDVLDGDEAVYGVNTGFGSLVDTRIEADDLEALQTNLLRSHAAGAGDELGREAVRALLLTRLNALAKGYSGIREDVLDLFVGMLNEGVHPVVPSRGSLGASGDLAPLAHLGLVLIGEGAARVSPRDTERASGEPRADVDGERLPGDEALAAAGLEPVTLRAKEGLALINGTQLTTGLAALALLDAERVLRAADVAGALTTEVTMSTTANCDPAIHEVRPHAGQAASARNVKRLTADSEVVESHRNCDRVQDAYSIRCLPQVHGAARDALGHLREAVEVELNSATDNPLVFDGDSVDSRASGTDRAAVVSGGNFHGEPLALRLDYAASALAELAAISERRTDRLLNPEIQEDHLVPFLSPESGLHSGLMIPQYTAASLVNDLRSLGRPSTDNTPVSGNQEDHVSMSAGSAYNVREAAEKAGTVVGVELLCAAQARELVDGDLALGAGTGAVYDLVREVSDPVTVDRSLAGEMETVADLIREGLVDESVARALGEGLE
ncbi:histidine ammonia-lyase [Halobacterium jilantaiense]|uniref:Probable histidine ammonia-lyase n=1 Tax=Halobacterium jilantaiense TaxID=355548 RepID=A0A1I0NBH4_9EURY|nr:histidine ammonia-lyase [Halobacterium jilantaiense]SEV98324.1 histidine ammonia-lyase [Halobacterium jilantaiense]